ncbi:ribonuclease P protein component [Mucilaginibacter ginkgonis]|uniref:Ribonuclease P protein component n=1 Tax=Mucilaginibacter ginkgonis TaxID=2682091 RepID=A0A6I4I1E8_9SPHI|nr:ribonuclease P protein component [Mucilaginibacter ginkgonis]QQL50614.1 ribonuclease P protein component [Mucilaginibacter ginkgonis]
MNTFKKEERLCNKKLLEQLFHKGSFFLCYPYRVSWLKLEEPAPVPVQVVFPVAKKRYKRAVDRNLIKRRTREAYRLNKQEHLYDMLLDTQVSILLSVSYIGKEINDFSLMQDKMLKLFKQLTAAINESNS